MPFGVEHKFQCPCNRCAALLPEKSLLGDRTRRTHRAKYGLSEVVEEEKVHEGLVEGVLEDARRPVVLGVVDNDLFAKDLVLLVVNHGISWKAAELVVKLVNSHAFGRFFGSTLPATAYQLKNITACQPGNAKLLPVCPVCDFVFDTQQHACAPCGIPPRMRAQRQLLVNDITETIKQMYGNPRLAEALEYAFHRRPGDGDVWDGEVMKDIPLGTHTVFYASHHSMIILKVTYIITHSIIQYQHTRVT